jgi:Mg2+ and Co2+ transporter CorA
MSGRRPLSLYECFAWHLNERFSMFPQTETDTYKAFQELILMSYEAHPHRKEAGDIVTYSLWVLSDRQWRDNLTFLRRAFAERRDKALARPGMDTYLPLIQLRQLMVGMRAHLPEVLGRNLQHEESSEVFKPDEFTPSAWKQTLTKASKDIRKMNTELDDEIHLIIGAVTVQDSDANKQQSERATLLTLLAAVYLPLTLVTGIFGMNITEIEAGKPNSRACGEVLAVVAACTVVFVFAYRHWRAWRRGQQEKERMELGFQKDV